MIAPSASLITPSPSCAYVFNAGSQSITLNYGGDATYACQATTLAMDVPKAATSMTFTRPAGQADTTVYGEPIQFKLVVTRDDGQLDPAGLPYVPTGSGLLDDAVGTSSGQALVNGQASFSISSFAVGFRTVTGTYNPSANYLGAKNQVLTHTIYPAQTSTTNVTADPNPSTVGQSVVLSATVTAQQPSQAGASGTVSFYRYPAINGQCNLAVGRGPVVAGEGQPGGEEFVCSVATSGSAAVSCSTTNLPTGTSCLSASFDPQPGVGENPASFYSSSSESATPHTVQDAVDFTLSLTSSATGAGNPIAYSSTYGTPVTFTAEILTQLAAPPPTGSVRFYGLDPANPDAATTVSFQNGASSVTSPAVNLPAGARPIRAEYDGDARHRNPPICVSEVCSNPPAADTRTLTVAAHATQITLGSNITAPRFGQTVVLTAAVTPTASPTLATGSDAPSGVVKFFDDTTLLGSSTNVASATLSYALLSVGSHNGKITAVFEPTTSPAQNFLGVTSTAIPTFSVGAAATTTTLTSSSAATTVVGTNVTFSAVVRVQAPGVIGGNGTSPATPPATSLVGSVTFRDGATVLGTVDVPTSGLGTTTQRGWRLTTNALAVGQHTITAVYNPTTSFLTSTSSVFTLTVNQDGISANVASSQNPSPFGTNVTYTATLTATTGGTPTGTVTFTEGATTIGTATLAGGVGSATQTAPTAGTHTIAVSYSGDTNHPGGPIATFIQTVDRAPTTTSLASSANPAVSGQSVRLTATVSSTAPGAIGGTVSFTDGATVVGTALVGAGGVASIDTTSLSVGPHTIAATYSGDTNFAGSDASALAQVLSKAATTTSLASSTNPSLIGATVTLTATVTAVAPAGGVPTGLVKFTKDGMAIGTAPLTSAGTASLPTSTLTLGANALVATYQGDAQFVGSGSTLAQNVAADAATITVSTSPSPSTFGSVVTLTATLTGSAAGGTPTGTVTFKNGATTLGTAPIDATGKATLATGLLPVGTLTVTATYSGSATYAAGNGTTPAVVDKAPTTTNVTSSKNPATVGESITFTATVTSAVGIPGGELEVKNGATTLGTISLANGTAIYTTSQIPIGTHPITVTYKGSATFATSNAALSQEVKAEEVVPPASTSSSGGTPPPAGGTPPPTVGTGNVITPGGAGGSGDDCAVAAPGSGRTGGFGAAAALACVALAFARRRRSARAPS